MPKFILLSDAARHESGINDHGASVSIEQHERREGNLLILCQTGKNPSDFSWQINIAPET